MNVDYPTDEVPATPEYVLDLFREVFRGWNQPEEFLSFDTSVSEFAAEWNDTILFWWELAKPLDQLLKIHLPIEDWKKILSPMSEHTIGEVCQFVASRMGTRQAIRPWHYIGGDCLPAGAFLTTRSVRSNHRQDWSHTSKSTASIGCGIYAVWHRDVSLRWISIGGSPPADVSLVLHWAWCRCC
jgi:hypothetical protein